MKVVLEEKAATRLKKFSPFVCDHIESILENLLSAMNAADIDHVLVKSSEDSRKFGQRKNQFDLSWNYQEFPYHFIFECGDELWNHDFLVISNPFCQFKYELMEDKNTNCYCLNLITMKIQKNSQRIYEICFYNYGNHINIYSSNHIYSFDIQGYGNVELEEFISFAETMGVLDLETILQDIQECLSHFSFSKILAEEYCDCKLVKNVVLSSHDILKVRYLKRKGKAC